MANCENVPDAEFQPEPDDNHNFEVVESGLGFLLVLMVLDGREHVESETEEDHKKSGRKIETALRQMRKSGERGAAWVLVYAPLCSGIVQLLGEIVS